MPVVRFDGGVFDLLQCPRCGGALQREDLGIRCSRDACGLSHEPFLMADGQPVLVDFATSIFSKTRFLDRGGKSVIATRDIGHTRWLTRLRRFLMGTNEMATAYARRIVADMRAKSPRPKLLIVGGGNIGNGVEELYRSEIDIVSIDVFPTPYTTLVADGHRLPFKDGSFDGVWIQAVLEHVLTPAEVVAEIHRTLSPTGIVFADTPFLYPVHEGAYDFTRFTLSGHRWLFRNFSLLGAGITGGPGTTAICALQYLIRAVTGSSKLAALGWLAFFWLRFFDRFGARRGADAASGVFFYGMRSNQSVWPVEMPDFYEQQLGLLAPPPRPASIPQHAAERPRGG